MAAKLRQIRMAANSTRNPFSRISGFRQRDCHPSYEPSGVRFSGQVRSLDIQHEVHLS
jgi:hypothetical protein